MKAKLVSCVFTHFAGEIKSKRCETKFTAEGLITIKDIKYYIDTIEFSNMKNVHDYSVSYKGTAQLVDITGQDEVFENGVNHDVLFSIDTKNSIVDNFMHVPGEAWHVWSINLKPKDTQHISV